MLLKRRDAGAGWSEIRAEWEKITGDTVGKSTLPNRYNRLKANVSVISEEDCARLLAAKTAVEKKFETEKWTLIATAIQQQGGGEYTVSQPRFLNTETCTDYEEGAALKTQHKKLMAEGVTGLSQGMVKGEVEEAEEDEF